MRLRTGEASTPDFGTSYARSDHDGLRDLRERVLSAVSLVAVAALLPYATVSVVRGAVVEGLALVGLVGLFAMDGLALYRRHVPPVPPWVLLVPTAAAVTLALDQDGPSGAFWCYPFVVFSYVVLSWSAATATSVALLVAATTMLAWYADGWAALRFFESLGLTLVVVNIVLTTIGTLRRQLLDHAIRDPLTGAFNRRHLDACLADAVERQGRTGAAASIVLVDVDHFKRINDRFGHAAGDAVLVGLAALVRGRLRRLDLLFRVGGEEFVVLLPDTHGYEARVVAEQMRAMAAEARWLDAAVTVSAGVSELGPGETPGAWLRRADEWLYVAKREGRNRVMGDGTLPLQPDLPYPDARAERPIAP